MQPAAAKAEMADSSPEEEEEGSDWETASESELEAYYRQQQQQGGMADGEEEEEEAAGAGFDAENPYGDPSQWEKWDTGRCLFCNCMAKARMTASLLSASPAPLCPYLLLSCPSLPLSASPAPPPHSLLPPSA